MNRNTTLSRKSAAPNGKRISRKGGKVSFPKLCFLVAAWFAGISLLLMAYDNGGETKCAARPATAILVSF